MATIDPRVDAYIVKAAAFARPILNHLRVAVHEGFPAGEETVKWSTPHFICKAMLFSRSPGEAAQLEIHESVIER